MLNLDLVKEPLNFFQYEYNFKTEFDLKKVFIVMDSNR